MFPFREEEGPVSKWVVTRGSWFLSQTPSGSQTLKQKWGGENSPGSGDVPEPHGKGSIDGGVEQGWLKQDCVLGNHPATLGVEAKGCLLRLKVKWLRSSWGAVQSHSWLRQRTFL